MLGTETRNRGVKLLAKKCRRSPTTISRVLRGTRDPGPELRKKLLEEGITLPLPTVVGAA